MYLQFRRTRDQLLCLAALDGPAAAANSTETKRNYIASPWLQQSWLAVGPTSHFASSPWRQAHLPLVSHTEYLDIVLSVNTIIVNDKNARAVLYHIPHNVRE